MNTPERPVTGRVPEHERSLAWREVWRWLLTPDDIFLASTERRRAAEQKDPEQTASPADLSKCAGEVERQTSERSAAS